jgi:hypothetical protein
MAACEVCGNDYDMAFEVHAQGAVHVLDSFKCAIHPHGAGVRALRVQDHRARRAGRRPVLLLRTLRVHCRGPRRGAGRPGVSAIRTRKEAPDAPIELGRRRPSPQSRKLRRGQWRRTAEVRLSVRFSLGGPGSSPLAWCVTTTA